jgi:drug/metabolite transporter (DMT)-like permease
MGGSRPGGGDYALLILLSAIWGSSFIFIKLAVDTAPAASATAVRLAVGALTMFVIARLAGQTLPRGLRLWTQIALAGLFGNALPFTLISWGEEVIDSGLAAILMAVMPLTTILLAHLLTEDEKLTPAKALGVFLGIAGLIVLIGPQKLSHLGGDVVRQLAVAAAATCYGINAILVRSLTGLPRRSLIASLLIVSFVMLLPVVVYVDRPWTVSPSALSWSAMAVLGLLHTALATLIMFAIVSRQGASFFSQINFLVPLFGVFWGVVALSENPPPNAYLALALILAGIAIARGSMGMQSHRDGHGD